MKENTMNNLVSILYTLGKILKYFFLSVFLFVVFCVVLALLGIQNLAWNLLMSTAPLLVRLGLILMLVTASVIVMSSIG
jgi:hypothetical protein